MDREDRMVGRLFKGRPSKNRVLAGCRWLTPVILPTQEAEIRKITAGSQPGQQFMRHYLKNTQHKKGLVKVVEHLPSKYESLSSNPSTT
jgi:hypothetical protein